MHRTISRRPAPPPRRRSRLLWLVALCGLALSACAGGSGSSGFDLATAENQAIDRALDDQGCQVNDGLTICASGSAVATPSPTRTLPPPSATAIATPTSSPAATVFPSPTTTQSFPGVTGTPTPSGTPGSSGSPTRTTTIPPPSVTATSTGTPVRIATSTPTPSFTPIPIQPQVAIDIGANDTIPCEQSGPAAPCISIVTFQPSAAPDTAVYRVAVRTQNPDSQWQVLPAVDNSAAIAVDTSPAGIRYQIAVLQFLQEPTFVAERVDLLADTGADFAFVTPLLTPEQLGTQ